jgi:hypothetical protein
MKAIKKIHTEKSEPLDQNWEQIVIPGLFEQLTRLNNNKTKTVVEIKNDSVSDKPDFRTQSFS